MTGISSGPAGGSTTGGSGTQIGCGGLSTGGASNGGSVGGVVGETGGMGWGAGKGIAGVLHQTAKDAETQTSTLMAHRLPDKAALAPNRRASKAHRQICNPMLAAGLAKAGAGQRMPARKPSGLLLCHLGAAHPPPFSHQATMRSFCFIGCATVEAFRQWLRHRAAQAVQHFVVG